MTDVDDAIERAELIKVLQDAVWPFLAHDPDNPDLFWGQMARKVEEHYVAEVKRLRRFIPPNGWAQFGTHANCRDAWLEFSEEVGEDGLPLWERVVVRQDLDPDEMVSDPRWTQ